MNKADTPSSFLAAMRAWAVPVPEMGRGIYRLTHGPQEHKHSYQVFCPWSMDGRWLLLLRYDRVHREAQVCVLDWRDGSVRVVGTSTLWNPHTAAYQQWQGATGRIVYYAEDDGQSALISVMPDGSDRRVYLTDLDGCNCTPDGRWAIGSTPQKVLFPEDRIAPREDVGLVRIDLQTGRSELILSIAKALALVPDAPTAAACHLYFKMTVPHRTSRRVLLNMTNTMWDRACGEPQVRLLMAVNDDGGNPKHLGPITHHPNWHPWDDLVVVNIRDHENKLRFGFYRGDGGEPLRLLPGARGAGHPSFTPDGRWICTDRMSDQDRCQITLTDLQDRSLVVLAEYDGVSEGYAALRALERRQANQSVMSVLQASKSSPQRTWQTHAHPTWSRGGELVLFNADLGQGSQLYAIDWRTALTTRSG